MRTELGLAWAGLRHRPGPWWLLALGTALAAVLPLLAAGAQSGVATTAVRRAVDAVPQPARGVLAVTSRDVRGPEAAALAEQVRRGYAAAGLSRPVQVLAFRLLAVGGQDTTVGALDDLPGAVALRSGRLPGPCRPDACEVLAVAVPGSGDAPPSARAAAGLGLVVTGTAELTEPRLAGRGLVTPGRPLLLGADPAAMAGLDSLTLYGRSLAWLSPLDGATVAAAGPEAFGRTLDEVSAEANLVAGPLAIGWPSEAALSAAARAAASASRFAVLGAGTGALLLGFGLCVAVGQRRRALRHAALLARRGARPGQVLQVSAAQPAVAVALGLVVGVLAGTAAVAALVRDQVARPWSVAGDALAARWPTVLALGLAAVLLDVAMLRWPVVAGRAVRGLLGLLLLGVAGLAALALVRPVADPASPLPVAALVALVLGVAALAALVWGPAATALGRLVRAGGPLRPVVLLTTRRPLLPAVTAGFLAAALATGLLAGGYGQTLRRSAADQAAAAVPLDVRITPSSAVPVPADVVDVAALQAVSPAVRVSGVVSSTVTAFAGSASARGLPLTGVEPDVLARVTSFATVTGADVAAGTLADQLRVPAGPDAAPTVPAAVRELRVATTGLTDEVRLLLWYATPEGQERQVPLVADGAGSAVARFPAGGDRVVRGLELVESSSQQMHRQHGVGEGSTDRPLAGGTLHLGAVRADGAPLPWSWAGWGSDTATVSAGTALSAAYRVGAARVVLVPDHVPAARRPVLPVAVDPATAARAGTRGTFGITLNGTTQPARVVAVLPRVPTLPAAFVLADRAAVSALVDRTAPGTAPVSQVWVSAPGPAAAAVRAALDASPAAAATVRYRADVQAALADDPVARGLVALLGVAGVVALLLSLVAAAAAVRADREATAADLWALELDGVPAPALRRVLALRSGLVLLVGVPLGLLGGAGLTAAAVRLLATGPDGRPVVPPLRVVLLGPATLGLTGAAVLGSVLAVGLAAASTLREPRPAAPEEELR